jgi:hypothetical protein
MLSNVHRSDGHPHGRARYDRTVTPVKRSRAFLQTAWS